MQLISEPARGGASLGLLFTNTEGLVGDVVVRGHLGLSDHEMTEFLVCGEVKRGPWTTTMDFLRADFGLLRMLVERVPWERVLKGKGILKGWTFFRKEVSKAQEQAVPMCCKTNWRGRRPAWLNRELLLGLRKKRRVYHLWMKGQATQEEYRGLIRSCRDLLCHLDTYKAVGLDGIHPRVLRELVKELAKPLSIIYQQSWLTGKVPDDCRIISVTPIYKKGWKEDLGDYRPVSLTSVQGKIME